MRIYISGVSGFLGGVLAHCFLEAGHQVLGSGSSVSSQARAPEGLERFDVLELGQPAPAATFREVDAIVHAAYNPASGTEELNVRGTDSWRQAAAQVGVKQQLFLSSHSADAEAGSEYGRQKYRLETLFLEHGHAVARCGLAVGNGGLFRRLMELVWRFPALPLVDGGRSPTLVTGPDDLAVVIEKLLTERTSGCANLFDPNPVALRDLLHSLRGALGRRTVLMPIPSALLLPPLWLARRLGIPLPVNEENLRGYRTNRTIARRSDYPELLGEGTSLEQMVGCAAADFLRLRKVTQP